MPLEAVPPETVADTLDDTTGTVRLEELIEQSPLPELVVRQQLDELCLKGEAKRFPVGKHIMVRQLDE